MTNEMKDQKSIFIGNFSDKDDVYINPDIITKKCRYYTYLLCTEFICFFMIGLYLFHCYIHSASGNIMVLSNNNYSRPFYIILLFEIIPFIFICISGITGRGFIISFLILAIKGIITGFTLYSFAFNGKSVLLNASFGVYTVYAVLYAISLIFAASNASSVSRILHKTENGYDAGRRSYVTKKYLMLIFPYFVLFVFTVILDCINLGF